MESLLLILFGAFWLTAVLSGILRVYRTVERHFEWRNWARRRGFTYFGDELPPGFPIDSLGDLVFYVKVRNCILSELSGRTRVAFDLDASRRWSRSAKWITIVAVQGTITKAAPWPYPNDADALQGYGWVMLQARESLLLRKDLLWRFIDAFPPPRQRLLEMEVVLSLWSAVEQVTRGEREG